jgi:hypothetical protein
MPALQEFLGARGLSPLLETFTAQYRPPLRRTEWNCGFFAALRAGRARLSLARRMPVPSGSDDGNALGLAVFATFRFVLKLFVVEKQLLSGCEHEIRATIHTFQHLVLEFH